MKPVKLVAIIGAGPSGLSAIKCCNEAGFEAVCFERNGDPGGLWRYHEEDIEGVASVMDTTVMNTCKEISAFSDFPPPKEFSNYMHHSQTYEYLMLYAKKFDLIKHIRFHTEVVRVERDKDYETTGRWVVSSKNHGSEDITQEIFDAVVICCGHHVYPNIPTFPGQENFRGSIIHSHSLKSCQQFSGQRVLVVGMGNSGADAAVDCSYTAKKVYLSSRSGAWVLSRLGKNGRPFDMDFDSRRQRILSSLFSLDLLSNRIEKDLNKKFDHEAYNLKPKQRVLSANLIVNDALPHRILCGRIIVKGGIQRFEEDGIVFKGEDSVTQIDVVVLATGYLDKFSFLDNLLSKEEKSTELYKYILPPALKHPTLAYMGLIRSQRSLIPLTEMQSRWFVQILLGNLEVPSLEDMQKDIQSKNDEKVKLYKCLKKYATQVGWISYMDELASEIGAKPNFLKMAFTDIKLFLACINLPCLPYQYRLQGPFAWEGGAREAILTYEKRVYAPLNTKGKTIPKSYENNAQKFVMCATVAAIALFVKEYLSFGKHLFML